MYCSRLLLCPGRTDMTGGRWYRITVSPVTAGHETPGRYVAITHVDVTEDQLHQMLLLERSRELSLRDTIHPLVHRLSDVLTGLLVSSEAPDGSPPESSPDAEPAAPDLLASREAQRSHGADGSGDFPDVRQQAHGLRTAAKLIHELNTVTKGASTPARDEVVELVTFLQNKQSIYEAVLGSGHSLRNVSPMRAMPVRIAPAHLQQVLMHLLTNARNAMPQGGTVHLSLTPLHLWGLDGIRRDYVNLCVRDEGVGLKGRAPETLFATTGRRNPTFGLYTSRLTARAARGELTISPETGGGVRATLTLPLEPVTAEHLAVAQGPEVTLSRRAGARCIVLCRDPVLRHAAVHALKAARFELQHAGEPKEAFAIASRTDESLDLLVVDEEFVRVPFGEKWSQLLMSFGRTKVVVLAGDRALLGNADVALLPLVWKPFSSASLRRICVHAVEQARDLPALGSGRERLLTAPALPSVAPSGEESPEGADPCLSPYRRGTNPVLDDALDTLAVHYQPLVRASDLQVFGYEALLRPQHPSFAGPVDLLLAAAEHGAMPLLGHRIRARIAEDLRERPIPGKLIFVNLHPSELRPSLASASEPLLPFANRVVFEVTERARLSEIDGLQETLSLLRRRGYRLAVDDLGEGYAGLVSLQRLRPEVVKLDRCIVERIEGSTYRRDLVQALQVFFRAQQCDTVAEGIETEAELRVLTDLGVSILQGYLLGRPAPWPWDAGRTDLPA